MASQFEAVAGKAIGYTTGGTVTQATNKLTLDKLAKVGGGLVKILEAEDVKSS